ncbi:MAG TPA: methylmalonyl-CoA mutase family protein, partial [Candidatus Dormibacteraeota bacterium]
MTRLFDEEALRRVAAEREEWEQAELAEFQERQPEHRETFLTDSQRPVKRVYTPADVAHIDWEEIGLPGRPPYTRGPYPTMYR